MDRIARVAIPCPKYVFKLIRVRESEYRQLIRQIRIPKRLNEVFHMLATGFGVSILDLHSGAQISYVEAV
ncbi:hypothetical protein V7S43_018704 [Phytophthora oleae]|uniref:Uncharacterized protein n=1 Tax=Phytophthora oleae TaxID=2107226 RepID=A0ABD3EQD0_9STRA